MKIEATETPKADELDFISQKVRDFNHSFVNDDYAPLCVFCRDDSDQICGGLTGKTYWNYLDIGFLWVRDDYRHKGLGTSILTKAEQVAIDRGCNYMILDTYSFQALSFYEKNGCHIFGEIDGFCGKHTRYYLRKHLGSAIAEEENKPS